MVDKLGSLSHVLMRLQQGRGQAMAGSPATQASNTRSAAADRPGTPATFQQRVMQRLVGIEPDDPRRRQRALRAFIEVRLLDEFGAGLANEAGFQQLVDDVVGAMQAQGTLKADIESAADQLLAKR